jgi:hypothetical protein
MRVESSYVTYTSRVARLRSLITTGKGKQSIKN